MTIYSTDKAHKPGLTNIRTQDNGVRVNKHGQGHFQWPDGSGYKGEFSNDIFEGQGEYKWSDGKSYKGQWRQGKMSGKGLYKWGNSNQKYEGEFYNDKRHGIGTFTWDNGKIYTGHWVNGKMHGEGTFILPDGTRTLVTHENGVKV